MALSVTRARIKEKCGIAGTTYDSTIDNLIAEVVPVLEYSVRAEHIADTGNAGLQATLNLGAAEVVCAEFLDQLAREPGAFEAFEIGELKITPSALPSNALRARGWSKLKPFVKRDVSGASASGVLSAGNKNEESEA